MFIIYHADIVLFGIPHRFNRRGPCGSRVGKADSGVGCGYPIEVVVTRIITLATHIVYQSRQRPLLAQVPGPVHIKAVQLGVYIVELQWVWVVGAVLSIHHSHKGDRSRVFADGSLNIIFDLAIKNARRQR